MLLLLLPLLVGWQYMGHICAAAKFSDRRHAVTGAVGTDLRASWRRRLCV